MNEELKLCLLMATSLLRRDHRANTADALEALVRREVEQKADLLAALMQLRNVAGHRFDCAFEMDTPCSCGLDEAQKASATAIAKAGGA